MRKIDEGITSEVGLVHVIEGLRIVGEWLYWRKRFLQAHLTFQRAVS